MGNEIENKDYYKLPYKLVVLAVLCTTFRGIIGNYVVAFTYLADLVYILILFAIVITKAKVTSVNKSLFYHYLVWIYCCVFVLCFQLVFSKNIILKDAVFSLRNNVAYTLPFALILMTFDNRKIYNLYNLILRTGSIISVFAIIQFVGRSWLPNQLLSLNVETAATLYGSDIVRVNGLMGNSIIFGGYTLVLIAMAFAKLIIMRSNNLETWIELILPVVANALTFSRASNVGTVIVCFSIFLLGARKDRRQDFTKRLIVAIILAIVFIYIVLTFFGNTIIVQRLLGTNQTWTQGSDQVHFSTIQNAVKVIEDNWLLGYGMGTVGYASSLGSRGIVRDGALWIWLLEFGIPLSVFYLTFIIRLFHQAVVKRRDEYLGKALGCAFIAVSIYLLGFSFINSAYSARSVYSFWWILAGMVVAINTNELDIIQPYES